MCKNNKLSLKRQLAKQFSNLHLQGQKGPSRTKAVHGKNPKNRWFYDRWSINGWYRRNEKNSKSPWRGT